MPTITNANLTLTTVNNDVTADVTFDAVFTRLERYLADMGMTFDRHVDIIGVDAGADDRAPRLRPDQPPRDGRRRASRPSRSSLSLTRPRWFFQEDTDNDEIGCNIRIHSQGFPPVFTPDFFTVQRVLVG